MSRDNYFLLLELDPSVTDPEVIRAALQTKRSQWSQLRNHPTRGRQAQAWLQQVKDIEALMADPVRREAEAREAGRIRGEQQQKEARELDSLIDTLAAKGFLLDKELAELVRRFGKTFGEDEVRERLPVPVRADDIPSPTARPTLPRAALDEIADRLRLVQKKDLYDFLDLPRNAGRESLVRRAEEREAEARRNNNKTAEVTACAELAGRCLAIFKSADEQQRYDNALDLQALLALENDLRVATLGGRLYASVLEKLERRAVESGVSREDAQTFLLEKARELGVTVEVRGGPAPAYRRCLCGRLNEPDAAACGECGRLLVVSCPRCSTRNPASSRACSSCGFAMGDVEVFHRLVRDADAALARGDLSEAERRLNEASLYLPGSVELTTRLKDVQRRRQQERDLRQRLDAALSARRFIEAATVFKSWRPLAPDPEEAVGIARQINEAVHEARTLARKAAKVPQRQQAAAYQQALDTCADLAEAAEGLARCPPEPPENLRARFVASRGCQPPEVVLTWQAGATQQGVRYRVLRRERADGPAQQVAEVQECTWTDSALEPGQALWYSVQSVLAGGAVSEPAAAEPVLVVAEVADPAAEVGDGEVVLTWKTPPGVRRVEVYRAEKAQPAEPSAPGTPPPGAELRAGSTPGRLRDASLTNGQPYGYRICCVFLGPEGREVVTPGEPLLVEPSAAPPLLTGLTASLSKGGVVMAWANPAGEAVKVVRSASLPRMSPGQVIPASGVGALGEPVGRVTTTQAVDPSPTSAKPCYLLFAVNASRATYAGAARFIEVEEASASVEDGAFVVRWDWPVGCEGMRVLVNEKLVRDPVPHEQGGEGVLRVPLDRVGTGLLDVRVACVPAGGAPPGFVAVAGPGKRLQVRVVRPRVVQWVLERSGWLARGVKVLAWSREGLGGVERLVVVGQVNSLPRDPDDGVVLGEWEPATGLGADGKVHIPLRLPARRRGELFCRVFGQPAEGLTILAPALEQAVL